MSENLATITKKGQVTIPVGNKKSPGAQTEG